MSAVYTFAHLRVGEPKLRVLSVSGVILPLAMMSVTVMLGSPVKPVHEPSNADADSVFVLGLYVRPVSLLSASTPVGLSANRI